MTDFTVAALSDGEEPPRAVPADASPVLSVNGFAGPLEWLLELARAQRIDLARLSILALVEAFAAALETALTRRTGRTAELGRWGDWLVMAATLALLRSRLLLPSEAPAARDAAQQAEALRHRLVGRLHMGAAADWLERRTQFGRDAFARGLPEVAASSQIGDISDLLRACLVALQVPEDLAAAFCPRLRLWTVSDAIARLRELLVALPDGSPLCAFLPHLGADPARPLRCRAALASTLLAGLELARDGALALDQEAAWRPIHLHRAATRAGDGVPDWTG
jgi:segregation and condensation protein A